MTTATTTLVRDQYGALYVQVGRWGESGTSEADAALYKAALALAQQAAASGKLPEAHDSMVWGKSGRERGKRIGEATYHEIYDIAPSGAAALICVRDVEGTQYGQSTTAKTYYLLQRCGKGVRVTVASKAVAAKAAKAAGQTIGSVIEVCQGKRKAPAPKCAAPRIGYKIVRRAEDGGYQSVWDESAWVIGKARVEAASADHSGGFYYYSSLDEAITEAARRKTFGSSRSYDDLSVLEVEVAGREYKHASDHGIKRCASRVKPLREVCAII